MTAWLASVSSRCDAGVDDRPPGDGVAGSTNLATTYDRIGAHGREALTSGHVSIDPLPVDGQERWGISVVLRPRWTDALASAVATLEALSADDSFVYGPANLHLTIRQLENYREPVLEGDDRVRSYVDVLADFARHRPPIEIGFRGLTVGTGGALLQGWPCEDLQATRLALHRALVRGGVAIEGPERTIERLRTTAHATLSIFDRQPGNAADVLAFCEAHRGTSFGTQTFDELCLVGYRRGPRSVRLTAYGRFALRGIPR